MALTVAFNITNTLVYRLHVDDILIYLLGLTVRNAPLGDGRSAAARRDDDVAFIGNGRQGDDAVESEKAYTHSVRVAACNSK